MNDNENGVDHSNNNSDEEYGETSGTSSSIHSDVITNNDPLHHHQQQQQQQEHHHHPQRQHHDPLDSGRSSLASTTMNGNAASSPLDSSAYHSLSYAYRTYLRHDIQEQNHWDDVCRSYRQYATFAMAQWANHQYRLHALPESQRQCLPPGLRRDTPEFMARAQLFKEAAIRNQFCLDCILRHAGQAHSQEYAAAVAAAAASSSPSTPVAPSLHSTDAQMSRVSSVLKSLVRDWSYEGKPERDMAYKPMLEMVQKYVPIRKAQQQQQQQLPGQRRTFGPDPQPSATCSIPYFPPRLCVPGAGVGRLALELAALGYTVQGNEFSLYMLLASDFILNGGMVTPHTPLKVSPWLLESRNLHQASDQYRIVEIPDVDPYTMLLANNGSHSNSNAYTNTNHASSNGYDSYPDDYSHDYNCDDTHHHHDDLDQGQDGVSGSAGSEFSMAAGEFVSIYSNPRERGQWDAVVACFFLDASPSLVEYLQVIHAMLKPGGYLFHFGPLLWHWSGPAMRPDDKTFHDYQSRYSYLDTKYLSSIDYCLEDVQEILKNVGFDIIKLKTGIRALYTADRRSMMNMDYRCCSFVARKKQEPGVGAAVLPTPMTTTSGSMSTNRNQELRGCGGDHDRKRRPEPGGGDGEGEQGESDDLSTLVEDDEDNPTEEIFDDIASACS